MTSKFLEICSGENLPPTKFEIVEVQKNIFMLKTKDSHSGLLETLQNWLQKNDSMGDSLFIADENKLLQWSVSQCQVIREYGEIMAGNIWSMAQTSDKNHLFSSDDEGC
jgi:hypothetical protein